MSGKDLWIDIGEGYYDLSLGGTLHLRDYSDGRSRAEVTLSDDGHTTVACHCLRCEAEAAIRTMAKFAVDPESGAFQELLAAPAQLWRGGRPPDCKLEQARDEGEVGIVDEKLQEVDQFVESAIADGPWPGTHEGCKECSHLALDDLLEM